MNQVESLFREKAIADGKLLPDFVREKEVKMLTAKDRIIVPLDVPDVAKAQQLVDTLSDYVGLFKIGMELFYSLIADLLLLSEGEALVRLYGARVLAKAIGGKRAFWDGKLHDIPNTAKGASLAFNRLGVKFFNIHASSGLEAMKAAVANKGNSQVLAVTVLTSLSDLDGCEIYGAPPKIKVVEFARMAVKAGLDGVICSPEELEILSQFNGELQKCLEVTPGVFRNFLKVTPGVRPEWASKGDQKRVMTPGDAIRAGADYLVIGRPITQPPEEIGSPVDAAKKIAEEINNALSILSEKKGD